MKRNEKNQWKLRNRQRQEPLEAQLMGAESCGLLALWHGAQQLYGATVEASPKTLNDFKT